MAIVGAFVRVGGWLGGMAEFGLLDVAGCVGGPGLSAWLGLQPAVVPRVRRVEILGIVVSGSAECGVVGRIRGVGCGFQGLVARAGLGAAVRPDVESRRRGVDRGTTD